LEEIKTSLFRQLDVEMLQSLLETQYFGIGDRLVYLPTVDSTNTYAMRLARSGSEEGVVVLTDSQTAGKGRQGRHWVDMKAHNAISSTVLRPAFPPYLLVMLAALAVVEVITETCKVTATIKWPNDVLIGTRKVAGILIETSHDHTGNLVAILGIGVNVNGHLLDSVENTLGTLQGNKELTTIATSLEEESGHMVNRELFIAHLLRQIEAGYLALQREAQDATTPANGPISRLMRERWRSQLSTLGRSVQVRQGKRLLSGVAEDVNANGELLLRTHSGEHVSITWGDVE